MGWPIPDPPIGDPGPNGFACPICWGVDKEFGDEGTPESFVISVSGINHGPNWVAADGEPPNGLFTVTQAEEFLPCIFDFTDADHFFAVRFEILNTQFSIRTLLNVVVFESSTLVECSSSSLNETDDHFTGGSIVIAFGNII